MKRLWLLTLLLTLLAVPPVARALDTTTRPVGPVREWSAADLGRFHPDVLQVKFIEGSDVVLEGGRFTDVSGLDLAAVNAIVTGRSVLETRRTFARDRATLRQWKARGEARSGVTGPDLSLWFSLRIDGDRGDLAHIINELNRSSAVEIAHPVPIVEPAVLDVPDALPDDPLRTPDFMDQQDYLYDPPIGMDAPSAWAYAGGRGEQMKFIDVERCWFMDHEDFTAENIHYIGEFGPWPTDCNHGTAVLGEVIGAHNGFGIGGFAPEALWGMVAYDTDVWPEVSTWFQEAVDHLDAGDIWLIEIQMYPPGKSATPMEWLQTNYDVIWTSSWAREVVCVEAGANGSQDLDDASWDGVFDRNVRDSGAIMVAAGTPTGLVAEYFTNYGSRMDVHGWGSSIVTTGYGDLYNGGSNETRYTQSFSGTSGASPMIVGSGLCLQGIAKAFLGYPFTPVDLRVLLHDTGTPHNDPSKEIGPRPDLAVAIDQLMLMVGARLAIDSWIVDDDDSGPSQGNGNGELEYGETIELTVTLENVGQEDAIGVQGTLLSNDPYIDLLGSEASFGDIAGDGGTADGTPPFVFAIHPDVPDQHEVAFRLAVTESPDTLDFALTLRAPDLCVTHYELDDEPGGNGNGIPEPGETIILFITVANQGSVSIDDVWGTLGGGPYVEADPLPLSYGTLDPGADTTASPFVVTISADCPDLYTAPLLFTLEGSGSYAKSTTFDFSIGDFFTADMEGGAASWSHYEGQTGYLDEWHLDNYRNHTPDGRTSWKCGGLGPDDYSNSVYAILESPAFLLPAGSQLSFWHWIDAEISSAQPTTCYDGGMIELSVDSGPWVQITPDGGYPYTLRAGSNPLPEGTPLFSGTDDWNEPVFSLDEYEGTARIRFIFASDGGVTGEGWYVDDVQLIKPFSAGGDRPEVIALRFHPASPNPANRGTMLRLDLPREASARVQIYDATGRRLRTLIDGLLPAGRHPVRWDGRDEAGSPAAAGIYWARARIEGEERTNRIVIVR